MSAKTSQKKLWFKAKSFGWGWYPSTPEGWVITLAYIVLVVGGSAWYVGEAESDALYFYGFFPFVLLLTVLLIWICWKTGEKPEWRWNGKPLLRKK